jgi:hypothetical protein
MHHLDAWRHRHRLRLVRAVPADEDLDLVPCLGQRDAQRTDVDVLPTSLARSQGCQRIGVL